MFFVKKCHFKDEAFVFIANEKIMAAQLFSI